MKKKLVLLMLSIAAVLCMIGFAACSNDTEDPPVTITDPTLQEQYDAFCEFIENDTDKYAVSFSMEQAGEKVTEMLSVASDRVYGKMTSEEYSQESYVWLNEGYAYTRTTYNNKTEHSVEYMPEHSFGIRTILNELSKELLYTEDFLASLQDNIAVANDAITFSFEDTQNGISCQNGTLTFAEDSVKINFDLLLLNLPVYDSSDAVVAVQIEINALGTNTVEFPFEAETEFAGITTLDRLYAQMVWVLDAESATLDVQMSGSFLTGVNTEIPFTLQLSGGEALAEIDIGGSATIAMGAICKDDTFFYITETTSGAQSSMDVSTEEYGYTVARFFELLSFNLRTKECFMLADGSETLLTLSEQGKVWYNYCDELLIDFSKPGEYVISAELNALDMPESLVCTIKDVGIEKGIEFPASWKEYIAFYVDGIRYTDISASGTYEVEATSLEQYKSDLVIPENITVNGQTYSVVSLNSNFLNGYDYALNSVVIPATVVNMNEALVGAYNLEFLYYGGTQASLEEVAGKTVPRGTIVYYYSEEQPQGEGNYWHWNEAHTAAERWSGGEEPTVQYQVYFDTNGNGYLDNSTVYASVIEEAPVPNSYDNMQSFAGWYTDPNCSDGNEVTFPYIVTGDITLYAKWEEAPITLEYSYTMNGYVVRGYQVHENEENFALIIPDTYNGYPIIGIDNSAFANCTLLTSIVIPNGVTSIGDSAFSGCTSLKSITIPNNVTYIGHTAFSDCVSLESISIPEGVTNIDDFTFFGCNAIESISIPDGVTRIGNEVFFNCSSLISIAIPDSVTSIGDSAFSGCTSLSSIAIPESITNIGASAFFGCASLAHISIPDTVKRIGENLLLETAYSSNKINWINGVLYVGNCLLKAETTLTDAYQVKDETTIIADKAFSNCSSLTSITIPDSVTNIGEKAFLGCIALTEITLPFIGSAQNGTENTHFGYVFGALDANDNKYCVPESLKTVIVTGGSIGKDAFRDCGSLTIIELLDGVTDIGWGAFRNCSSLANITIPNSVTSIESWAFNGCRQLTSVYISDITAWCKIKFSDRTSNPLYYAGKLYCNEEEVTDLIIPDGVTSICEYAFTSCTSLTSVTIPDSVTSVGWEAFWGCSSLTEMTLPFVGANQNGTENTHFGYIFGAEYSYENDIRVPETLETVTVTDGKVIGNEAFYACSSLINITLSGSVAKIGEEAFYRCFSLINIALPDSVIRIGSSAFVGCHQLANVYVDDIEAWCLIEFASAESNPLGVGAELYCDGNKVTEIVIPENVTNIRDYAFYGFGALAKVTIPNSVAIIGDYAFSGCTGLTEITIPQSIKDIGNEAFRGNQLKSVSYLGDIVDWCGINGIGELMLGGYDRKLYLDGEELKGDLVIPDTVKSIPSSAFYDCNEITSVKIGSGVSNIGSYAFSLCDKLSKIEFGENVKIIGDYAFAYCGPLKEIQIPNGAESIGQGAFNSCGYLNSIIIPDSVKNIGENAFDYTQYYYSTENWESNILYIGKHLIKARNSNLYTIKSDTLTIAGGAFSGCSSLTNITIPDTVTSIGDYAFSECTSLTSITIPNSVMSIGDRAFYGCSSLTSVSFGENSQLTSIGEEVFSDCSNLKNIEIPVCVTNIGDSAFNGCSELTSITIPDSVTSIGDSTFSDCSSLTSITIPASVTSIADYAFSGCSNLTSVAFGENSQLTSIGDSAFNGCSSLISITIPEGVTSIGNYLFYGCSSLTSITISDGVMNIGDYAFYGCTSLTSITIPNGVTSIGGDSFRGCSSLKNITVPDSVASIGNSAFADCTSLKYNEYDNAYYIGNEKNPYVVLVKAKDTSVKSCIIHENTKIILNYAFQNCRWLTSITIPNSVSVIDDLAFDGCSSLKNIYYCGTEEQWHQIWISTSENYFFENATRYYYSETYPFEGEGALTHENYWHYAEDGITPIIWSKETT